MTQGFLTCGLGLLEGSFIVQDIPSHAPLPPHTQKQTVLKDMYKDLMNKDT